jgi:hypothetical protein
MPESTKSPPAFLSTLSARESILQSNLHRADHCNSTSKARLTLFCTIRASLSFFLSDEQRKVSGTVLNKAGQEIRATRTEKRP